MAIVSTDLAINGTLRGMLVESSLWTIRDDGEARWIGEAKDPIARP